MSSVRLRSVELGSGRPKVCVSLLGTTVDEMVAAVNDLVIDELDLVEVRLDHVAGSATDVSLVADSLRAVRAVLADGIPIIATFRSEREGGVQPITPEGYVAVIETATGLSDAIDIELTTPRPDLDTLVAQAKATGVAVIISNHDFEATPSKTEIVERLLMEQALGADIVKVAAMPLVAADVITLLAATDEFVTRHATVPTITMSMGGLGAISRIAGETFGSCLTFGFVGAPSAPGQLGAGELRAMLERLHRAEALAAES
ncbi:type I 3-dehydroquinate dehydratase [soil metagenome]